LVIETKGAGPFQFRYVESDGAGYLCLLIAINTHLQRALFSDLNSIRKWWDYARKKLQRVELIPKYRRLGISANHYDNPETFGFPLEALDFLVEWKVPSGYPVYYKRKLLLRF
jgi:hypothetical protein